MSTWPQDSDEPPWYDDEPAAARPLPPASAEVQSRMIPGGSFLLDAPDRVPAVWGNGDAVLWAQGESLILGGPPGVGKTTLAAQVVRGRVLGGRALDLEVEPTKSRVLYLAMDRPQQIARALRRTLGDIPRETLDASLTFWKGPPVADIAKHPETLLGYANVAGADTIVVDSLKDAAIGLTDDEVGAGYNRARQLAIAAGIEVLELHHTVKRGPNGAKPKTLADLYGSTWLTSGAGSVVLLWGEAGDPIVELIHLKTPAAEVGPFRVIHDHDHGTSQVWHQADLLAMARAKRDTGLTARDAAKALFSVGIPTSAQIEKARRKLAALAKSGGPLAERPGDKTTGTPTVWVLEDLLTPITESLTHPPSTTPLHGITDPSRSEASPQVRGITAPITTITHPDLHVSTPSRKGGGTEGPADDRPQPCPECGRIFHTIHCSRSST